jgi:hypothetical protein
MYFVTEEQSDAPLTLFVRTRQSTLLENLMSALTKSGTSVNEVDELPENLHPYTYVFVFYDAQFGRSFFKRLNKMHKRIVVITYDPVVFTKLVELSRTEEYQHLRVINVDEDETHEDYIEKIMWFATTESKEKGLNLEKVLKKKKPAEKSDRFFQLPKMTRGRWIGLTIACIVFLETFFLVPLGISGYYLYRAGQSLERQESIKAIKLLRRGRPFLRLTEQSYAAARPLLSFFFFTLVPENLIQVEKNGYEFAETAMIAKDDARTLFTLLLKPQKSPEEIATMSSHITKINEEIETLYRTSGSIKDTLTFKFARAEKIQARFTEIHNYLETARVLMKHADSLLAKDGTKNYIVFFYNNMEIRPGGGFIGSFAHLSFDHYSIKEFKIYDVYDADGQLTAHIEPPKAIRLHLGQPHWFLRDSNFSPDFEQNTKTAEYFLDKELQLGKFDGSFGITTTAMTYMLEAFGDVYVPDFEETINKDNFYLKTQAQTEKEFFPGSKQKKNYLSSIGRMLFLKLDAASPATLAKSLRQAFDEKHIVMFMKDKKFQEDIEKLHWSGQTIYPQCAVDGENCLINHIFPVDANLGVNKANYFVSKFIHLVSRFQKDGSVKNELTINFTNNSASDTFPGGKYTNYFQLYLPNDAEITSIEIDGTTIEDYDETKSGFFKILGMLLEVQPASSSYINVAYTLKTKAVTGQNTYQVVIQKQIGAFNSDFTFEVYFPNNMFITDQNFKSLAKNNAVGYNSSLSTDKIFVLQFIKE